MNRRLDGMVGAAIESISQRLASLSSFPPFGVVKEILPEVGVTSRKVSHGLGRSPIGWVVIYTNCSSYIYEDSTDTQNRDKYINFAFSAAVPSVSYTQKIKIWFF